MCDLVRGGLQALILLQSTWTGPWFIWFGHRLFVKSTDLYKDTKGWWSLSNVTYIPQDVYICVCVFVALECNNICIYISVSTCCMDDKITTVIIVNFLGPTFPRIWTCTTWCTGDIDLGHHYVHSLAVDFQLGLWMFTVACWHVRLADRLDI